MKAIQIIPILLTLIGCLSEQTDNAHVDNLSLKEQETTNIFYLGIHSDFKHKFIELKEDSVFVYQYKFLDHTIGGDVTKIKGDYKIDSNYLVLYPEYILYFKYNRNGELIISDSMDYFISDTTEIPLEFNIVCWSGNTYLLNDTHFKQPGDGNIENDYYKFAHYYNSGSEPNKHGWYFVNDNRQSGIDEKLDLSQIPEKYRGLFLIKPIEAKLIDAELVEKTSERGFKKRYRLYKLDKGKLDGVYINMYFYGEYGGCMFKITLVEDSISYGVLLNKTASCDLGERVSTNNIRINGSNAR